jgi:hypothetical protein
MPMPLSRTSTRQARPAPVPRPHRQQHAAARRELDGVVDQVGQHAAQRDRIGPRDGAGRAAHRHAAVAGLAREVLQQGRQRHRHGPQRIDGSLDAPDFEQLVGEPFQRLLRPRERDHGVLHRTGVRAGVQLLAQHLGLQADGHHRLAQVVVGGGEEAQPFGLRLLGSAQARERLFAQRALVQAEADVLLELARALGHQLPHHGREPDADHRDGHHGRRAQREAGHDHRREQQRDRQLRGRRVERHRERRRQRHAHQHQAEQELLVGPLRVEEQHARQPVRQLPDGGAQRVRALCVAQAFGREGIGQALGKEAAHHRHPGDERDPHQRARQRVLPGEERRHAAIEQVLHQQHRTDRPDREPQHLALDREAVAAGVGGRGDRRCGGGSHRQIDYIEKNRDAATMEPP